MVMRQNASTGEVIEDAAIAAEASKAKAHHETLQVKVWSPFHAYYDGIARSISGINSTGPFDILPQHHNFITLLNKCDLVLQTKEGEVKIRISGGIMQVHRNTVTVYLEA
jgi:F0F1-type ATP synthase epsilon subunit